MDDRTLPTSRPKSAPPGPRNAAREARRAEALRINLRRRKAATSPGNTPPSTNEV